MTRAEAIKLLDLNREYLKNTNNIGLKDDIEALDMAIQALSQEPYDTIARFPEDRLEYALQTITQEPCDDAISREAAIEAVKQAIYNHDSAIMRLTDLPSVTQKSGKWIIYHKGIYAQLICDKCLSNAPYNCRTNYCPNCGTRMESEDSE